MSSFITNASDVIVLIVLFSFTIFVHELGHFLVALKCGMLVDTFSIGFGPAIWKKKWRGVNLKVGAIPFGGYVALPQLDPSGMAAVQGKETPDTAAGASAPQAHRELPPISPWKKILVSMAGATGNVILAFVLALSIWLSPKAITYKGTAELGQVEKNSLAYQHGLRAGDTIEAVNGKPVVTWYDFSMECLLIGATNDVTLTVAADGGRRDVHVTLVSGRTDVPVIPGVTRKGVPCLIRKVRVGSNAEAAGLAANDIVLKFDGIQVDGRQHLIELVNERDGVSVPIVIRRDGKVLDLSVTPEFDAKAGRALMGVELADIIMPWMQEKRPLAQLKNDATGIVRLLRALVTPREAKNAAKGLGGPAAILATLWISIKLSIFSAIGFLRFLNLNLAILNLLPIPVLDGGHIVFSLWEGTTRRKVHPKIVNALVNVFAILLICLFIVLTFKDVKLFFWRKPSDDAGTTNAVEQVEQPAPAPAK